MSKCLNCKYYMEVTYATKNSDIKAYCLKLIDSVSINVPITECNQFISNIDLTNNNPIKT